MMKRIMVALGCVVACASSLSAQAHVDHNVIYGMYSGTALLLDVHHPAASNSRGILAIIGGGWMVGSLAYGSKPMKDNGDFIATYVAPLTSAGYTVFVPNYRGTPRFPFPAGVDDVARAVRFIRSQADKYGIAPDLIGAVGGSAGAYFSLMVGTREYPGVRDPHDPIDQQSARVQAVIAMSPATDLTREFKNPDTASLVSSFLGGRVRPMIRTRENEDPIYREASPISFVSGDSAPTLLVHGEADETLPIEQSELMYEAFRVAGVPTRLLRVPRAGHTFSIERHTTTPDYFVESVRWFDQHLKVRKVSP